MILLDVSLWCNFQTFTGTFVYFIQQQETIMVNAVFLSSEKSGAI